MCTYSIINRLAPALCYIYRFNYFNLYALFISPYPTLLQCVKIKVVFPKLLSAHDECAIPHCPEHGIARGKSRQMQAFYTIKPCSRHDKKDTGHGNVFVFNIGATFLCYIYKNGILYLRKGKQALNLRLSDVGSCIAWQQNETFHLLSFHLNTNCHCRQTAV
jgi:hypothetical protein